MRVEAARRAAKESNNESANTLWSYCASRTASAPLGAATAYAEKQDVQIWEQQDAHDANYQKRELNTRNRSLLSRWHCLILADTNNTSHSGRVSKVEV